MTEVLPSAVIVRLRDGSRAYVHSQDRGDDGEVVAIHGTDYDGQPIIWQRTGHFYKGIRKSPRDIMQRFDSNLGQWIRKFPIP